MRWLLLQAAEYAAFRGWSSPAGLRVLWKGQEMLLSPWAEWG